MDCLKRKVFVVERCVCTESAKDVSSDSTSAAISSVLTDILEGESRDDNDKFLQVLTFY
jgi:hypothetical protein